MGIGGEGGGGCGRAGEVARYLPVVAVMVESSPLPMTSGVVLHPTSFDAVHPELEYNISCGGTLDTERFTIIVPNMMGNGVSASPSTLMKFPRLVTIADNVRAQHQATSLLPLYGPYGARGAEACGCSPYSSKGRRMPFSMALPPLCASLLPPSTIRADFRNLHAHTLAYVALRLSNLRSTAPYHSCSRSWGSICTPLLSN